MKLNELLEVISPIPWTSEPHSRTTQQQRDANELYRLHSANALPELVEASQQFLKSILLTGGATQGTLWRIQNAIAEAEEVKDP